MTKTTDLTFNLALSALDSLYATYTSRDEELSFTIDRQTYISQGRPSHLTVTIPVGQELP